MNIHFLLKCFLFEGKHSLIFVELVGSGGSWKRLLGQALDFYSLPVLCTNRLVFFLGGGFKHCLFSSLFGELIQFDEHIFQMG